MMYKALRLVFILMIFFYSAAEVFSQGCSQCKLVPQSNMDNGGSFANKLNPAILYLMAVPYVIMLLIFRKQIISLFKSLRNKKAA